ncbi:hypothetical protein [Lentzea californiensis]|uniref:hypothetical protein n=1 Tax=Lentzea californiensis TaxID=438851 RepID=UPI00216655EC|nr:hypothetical protein [Lentzea californiensis]MCR3749900.1 hypothetical protein [Lentzea californiensis]
MLKKAFAAAAVGAGFLMMGTPAFATQGGAMDDVTDLASKYDHDHQVSLVNMENAELLSDINVCHVDVNVIAVPAFSGNDGEPCVDLDIEGEHSHGERLGTLTRATARHAVDALTPAG